MAAVLFLAWPAAARAQDDSVRVLEPLTVTVTRTAVAAERLAGAVSVVDVRAALHARPAMALDEVLAGVPGVFVANRWNFSLDQRISIRGFGARSSFGIRGVRVLLDGIPQTLPDGSGQLTNVELASADRVEVLRGPGSSLHGNATGGVISIRTAGSPTRGFEQEARLLSGPLFSKWHATSTARLGPGYGSLTASRLRFHGERQHSAADVRHLNARYTLPIGAGTVLSFSGNAGDDPVADNPGALTAAELAANRDSAAAINLTRRAGKDVRQLQGGVSLRHTGAGGGETELAVFALDRRLRNPQTFAWIGIDRRATGLRATASRPVTLLGLRQRLTAGFDAHRQRDDRTNFGNNAGAPDTARQLDQLERVTELGPFARTVIDLDDRLALAAGARYDWVTFDVEDRLVSGTNPDDSGRRVMRSASWSLGVTMRLADAVIGYANAGTSFETPTTTELANRPDTAGGFNATLEPQRALSFEAGVRGAWGAGRGSISFYRAQVKDALISYQIPSSPGRVFFQNAGRSRHQGVEIGAAVGSVLQLAYTFSDFRYTDYTARGRVLDGRQLPGIPTHLLQATWRVAPRALGGAWLEAQHTHSSGVLVDDTLATRTEPWMTADVRAGWSGTIRNVHLAPFLGVGNILNARYVGSVVINAANGRYYEPAPGRHWHVGLSLKVGSRP